MGDSLMNSLVADYLCSVSPNIGMKFKAKTSATPVSLSLSEVIEHYNKSKLGDQPKKKAKSQPVPDVDKIETEVVITPKKSKKKEKKTLIETESSPETQAVNKTETKSKKKNKKEKEVLNEDKVEQ